MGRVYNFSAGPAVLPEEVLREAAEEMMDYRGSGMSVMEMSHRSQTFQEIIDTAEAGDIILLHDIYRESVEGALMAIDAMKDKGYTFVTVSELFEKNGIEMEPGKIYRKTYH